MEAEDPVKLSIRSVLFILLAYFADEITALALEIGGTPYEWIMTSELPSLDFASFNSVMLTILGASVGGAVAVTGLILLLITWPGTTSSCYLRLRNDISCLECWYSQHRSRLRWEARKQRPGFSRAGAGCLAGRSFCF